MKKSTILKILKSAKTEYAYDNKQKIYSAKFFINDKARILTMRLGKGFVEFSLADESGRVMEILKQEGNLVEFYQTKK